MSEDFNRPNFGQEPEASSGASAPRARNRTVLLNSETAGKLRRQFEDSSAPQQNDDPWKQPKMESGGQDSFFGGKALGHDSTGGNAASAAQASGLPEATPAASQNNFASIIGGGNDNQATAFNQPQPAVQTPVPSATPTPTPNHTPQPAFEAKPAAFEPQPHAASQPQSAFAASFPTAEPKAQDIFGAAPNAQPQAASVQPAVQSTVQGAKQEPSAVFDSSESGDHIMWYRMSKVVGFLLSFDKSESGDFYPLRTGRLLVTRDAQGPKATKSSYFLIADESVSVGHAILRLSEGDKEVQVEVLDQLSEDGTKIVTDAGEVNLSGDKGSVKHGDKLVFGGRTFTVLLNG